MKKDIYKINNSIDKLIQGKSTLFLDKSEYNLIKSKIKNNLFKIYLPYKDSEKIILYASSEPDISLIEIKSNEILRHQDILGSILALNISNNYLGDIIIDKNNMYFYIISSLKDYVINNLNIIGKTKVKLSEVDIHLLDNYQRKYEEIKLIVSSLRIDNVLSKLIKTNRDKVIEKIKNKEVIINYNILAKVSYVLKNDDVFSVRRYGKFIYKDIISNTKRDNYIIKILKYI